jgi:hypothetical protein
LINKILRNNIGKKMRNIYKIILAALVLALTINMGCSEEITQSLYQDPDPGAAPVISSIEPANSALAGVSVITINGSNFSADTSQVVVFFNSEYGQIIQSSPTQMIVKVPNLVSDSVAIRIAKVGVEHFSNMAQYQLTPAYAELIRDIDVPLFTENLVPWGLTTDAQGNLYTSIVEFSVGLGVKKISPQGIITPTGMLQDFAPKGGETFFPRLNMWQNNTIIGARRVAAIFQIVEGTAAAVFVSGIPSMNDIDFDQNLNIWAGGTGIVRVTPDKAIKTFQYPNPIKSVRVFDNHLYILTTISSEDVIQRFPIISSDSLGVAEDFFNVSQSLGTNSAGAPITALDFDIAADGDVIVGTTRSIDPIIVIHQDGSFESLYPGVVPLNTRVYAFAWDPAQYLYFTREASGSVIQSIIRLDMQKQGAPQYGR